MEQPMTGVYHRRDTRDIEKTQKGKPESTEVAEATEKDSHRAGGSACPTKATM
jgi:hypothetical protein